MMWSRTSLVCVTVKGEKTGVVVATSVVCFTPKSRHCPQPVS
jgi:hypothetical protein